MQDFLVRFVHQHEDFRVAELESLAEYEQVPLEIVRYEPSTPYCLIRVPSTDAAQRLIRRSILVFDVHELWGQGSDYNILHQDVKKRTSARWAEFETKSFWFVVRSFLGKRSLSDQRRLIDTFDYLPFKGPIRPANAEAEFVILERFGEPNGSIRSDELKEVFFGLKVGTSSRDLVTTYDLKKRAYISTTSMDAELALITANLALSAPGRLVYDPFLGTAGFPIAAAAFGASSFGSDIDGRSFRGQRCGRIRPGEMKPATTDVSSNFVQYNTTDRWLGAFTADLVNTPIRATRFLDAVICDPPYGVREGIKVLGSKKEGPVEEVFINGQSAYKQSGYIPPKKPYPFAALLDDILSFAATTLVDRGRLAFWIPVANEEDEESPGKAFPAPQHPSLELVCECVQPFNKWSRRLVVYRRRPDCDVSKDDLAQFEQERAKKISQGGTADDLNEFRKRYFRSFRSDEAEKEADPAPDKSSQSATEVA